MVVAGWAGSRVPSTRPFGPSEGREGVPSLRGPWPRGLMTIRRGTSTQAERSAPDWVPEPEGKGQAWVFKGEGKQDMSLDMSRQ